MDSNPGPLVLDATMTQPLNNSGSWLWLNTFGSNSYQFTFSFSTLKVLLKPQIGNIFDEFFFVFQQKKLFCWCQLRTQSQAQIVALMHTSSSSRSLEWPQISVPLYTARITTKIDQIFKLNVFMKRSSHENWFSAKLDDYFTWRYHWIGRLQCDQMARKLVRYRDICSYKYLPNSIQNLPK